MINIFKEALICLSSLTLTGEHGHLLENSVPRMVDRWFRLLAFATWSALSKPVQLYCQKKGICMAKAMPKSNLRSHERRGKLFQFLLSLTLNLAME